MIYWLVVQAVFLSGTVIRSYLTRPMALVKKLLQNRRKVTKIHTAVFLMLPAVGFFSLLRP